ncbi:MAG TPA: DUF2306 domain-containing protein [Chryseosolibacter sp.]|nr:DUF2306 domain-containing protein [Chryseosolibacter sp.]
MMVLSIARNIGVFVVVLLAVALAYNALSYINFDPHYGFLRLKQAAIATGWYLPGYYSHVLLGGLILVIGLFQVIPVSRRKFPRLHRYLGYIYVIGILAFAAPGGLLMSFFIDRGPFVLASFVLQATLWFYFTAMAFDRIRKRDIIAHRAFMWRSYALTFAAITLRVYIFLTSWSFDLSQPEAYAVLAWLSWVPNLIVVEVFIRRGQL